MAELEKQLVRLLSLKRGGISQVIKISQRSPSHSAEAWRCTSSSKPPLGLICVISDLLDLDLNSNNEICLEMNNSFWFNSVDWPFSAIWAVPWFLSQGIFCTDSTSKQQVDIVQGCAQYVQWCTDSWVQSAKSKACADRRDQVHTVHWIESARPVCRERKEVYTFTK